MNKKIWVAIVLFVLLASIIYMGSLNSAKADGVVVISSSSFTDSVGYYHIVGEVQNTGSSTVDFVQVTATYYDSNNKVVDTQFAFTSISHLQPNAKAPFDIIEITTTLVPQINTYKLGVSSMNSGSIQQGLEITSNSSYTDSVGYLHIVGQIQNIGSATSSATEAVATCYDSSGKVVDDGFAFTNPQDMTSGSTAPFEIIILDTSQIPLIASYSLTAQSSDYALVSASSSTPPTPTQASTQTSQTSNPTATPTVAEFPTLIILPLFALVILLSIVFVRKKIFKT
jgi:uncharacterized protein (TIGR02588 family)